ncbi:MAG: hypothetical protein AUK06_00570 [Parcubacteria group bacterium CG2_30_36_18]|uniref:Uncharacterized protein n=4 Tax=Candidatus Nealsoniibacteriota TaxID=1817911 RepID=A0A2M8DL14_9BACT|nr:MAG: hypothetical protein AUK06_00570 [Parcubacteria group bacterium CG2_30_36_18]PIP24678.1 MAG: hypothetical protein COX33_00575 [Candidatus Nealsonbacteria bacterium CG23_combo_of_CG06-09_8_20_14_all_36_125]PIR72215.1 MAG: hypothetical protein COU41_00690 [Candidatus Nealsonbacteria bacterium CG10_big_fil_rev_8_21_14_0_10_36_228]PIX88625.1 MAG: hypothetical protein COZ30_00340 [Candidatus Nealsonbacteria bacterium CG_4_10_14_3_um_filter_36_16]PJB98357.1 MAG: hypothetical protein CO078_020
MDTKIFGWVLLIAGVIIIFGTLYSSYNIFTGKATIPEIFKIEAKKVAAPTEEKIPASQTELQKEMEKMIGEQLQGLIPTDVLPKMLNLFVWSILAGLLIFGGSQLSSLGIKLIKE